MGSKLPRRALAAVLLLAVWQTNHFSSAWSNQFPKQQPRRRAPRGGSLPDPNIFNAMDAIHRAEDILNALQGLDALTNLWQKGVKAYNAWVNDDQIQRYPTGTNATLHASCLLNKIEKNLKQGENLIIPSEFHGSLPQEPVRNTSIERLMVEVLCDTSQWGMRAIYAEPGSGKSVATKLAAAEVSSRQTSDFFVVLQTNLDLMLCFFFGVSQVDEVDLIVDSLFGSLQKKRIRLNMIMDNILDAGVRDDKMKDRMKALARAATKYGHLILFTTQDKESAKSIGELNGVTTDIAEKQNFTAGAYRWNEKETLKLSKILVPNKKPEELKDALRGAEIPDLVGGWRPRDTEVFLMTGKKPRVLHQAGTETQTKAVWVRQLRQDGAGGLELAGNAFKITGQVSDIDDLKEAIKRKNPQTVLCDAFQIDIYLQQEDGSWNKQDEEAALERGASKSDCYGFLLPQRPWWSTRR